MAQILGSSAALRTLLQQASQIDSRVQARDLDALEVALRERRAHLAERRRQLPGEIAAEATARLAELDAEAIELATRDRALAAADAERAAALARRATAQRRRRACFLVRWLRVWSATRAEQRELRRAAVLRTEAATAQAELQHRRARALRMQQAPDDEAVRRLAHEVGVLEQLETLLQSPVARGAHGEVAAIESLRRLPDDFVVLNGLQLRARSFLRFAGTPLQSAQIDHLVLGPTGVFVVETKAWSRAFAASGAGFDPFEQVARAGLLCHALLADADLPGRVRQVICAHERPQPSTHEGFTAVVAPDRLDHWLRTRQRCLAADERARVVLFLRQFLTDDVESPRAFDPRHALRLIS